MSNNPSQQVKNCLVDEPTYKKNRKPIVQQIGNGNRYSSFLFRKIHHLHSILLSANSFSLGYIS